ncbi:MAG: OB-fold nucleic acid binding domain-containing protein [Pseudomonadota bacterium]
MHATKDQIAHPTPQVRWPQPPSCLPHDQLQAPPNGARICVAGLVLVRQRPGTAHGVVFITLEDETGISNIIVWKKTFETYRRAVIAGRMLKVTGTLQRESGVCHIIAEHVEDISYMLDTLLQPPGNNRSVEALYPKPAP